MGSLSWGLSEGQKTALLRLNASDSRAMGGTPYFFQLINLQASLNEGLGRNASWGGNLTMQAARQGTATTPVSTTTTSSADLSYRHQRALNVPRLSFTSELRIYGDALFRCWRPRSTGDTLWETVLTIPSAASSCGSARVAESIKQNNHCFGSV
jgi:hypothetical protein